MNSRTITLHGGTVRPASDGWTNLAGWLCNDCGTFWTMVELPRMGRCPFCTTMTITEK